MTYIKRCKSLVGDFYKRFILKDPKYIGYSPCEYLCDRFILSFMYKYSRKYLSEEIIQQFEDMGYVTGFNDDHLVKYLCLNIIDSDAYASFILEDIYEKIHKAFGQECSCLTLYVKSIQYIKWALCKKDSHKCWMSKYVKILSPMGTLDTSSYNIPNDLRAGTINIEVLQSLYDDTNIPFDEFIRTIIINKKLFLPKPETITISQDPMEKTDLNKLSEGTIKSNSDPNGGTS